MTGLAAASAVTAAGDGRFTADLLADWEIWGPQGGYLAAVAMRAAGAVTGRARPASITAHFVGAGTSGPVSVDVAINRETTVATSASVQITQHSDRGERVLLTALVWGVDADLPGLEHRSTHRPLEAMNPDGLPSMEELMAGRAGPAPHPFWANIEQRPVRWIDDWDNRTAGEPENQCWFRFVDGETHADPWLDSCRSLVVLDLESWGAATRAHSGELAHYAPTIEVTTRFIDRTHDDPWLLSDARRARGDQRVGGVHGNGLDTRRTFGRRGRKHTALPTRSAPT